ncbi:MAG: DMT family protein [Deltaproteobacteria bacterium]
MKTISLLFCSNIFMTFAWYGHLKDLNNTPLYLAILASWGIAFFEYVLQVPANRIGYQHFTLPQLKVIQEVITMVVFAGFATFYMRQPLKIDYLWGALCLIGAAYFMFRSA